MDEDFLLGHQLLSSSCVAVAKDINNKMERDYEFTSTCHLNDMLKPGQIGKIAAKKTYPTKGNWKLALDNFHECYHCQPSHPEYCHVHSKEYIQILFLILKLK